MGDLGSPVTRAICSNQKIRSNGDYQNFSVLGLFCILAIGGITILASLLLAYLLGAVHERMKLGREGRTRWMADSNLQVQRMMYEGRGYNKWQGHTDTVPVYLEELPVNLDGATFPFSQRVTTEKMEEASDPKQREIMTTEIEEASDTDQSLSSTPPCKSKAGDA